jgi:hypothetical protein
MTSPVDPEFEVMSRGACRDLILNYFRAGLRRRFNPETNALFTEDEIAQATGPGSRWYREASGIDDYCQGRQRTALFTNDIARVDRANSAAIENYHARVWDPEGRLAATGASGTVTVSGVAYTPITASTTIPDPTACWGRDAQGFRYQVYSGDETIDEDGTASVTVVAMDTGAATNLLTGARITWAYRDIGMAPEAVVTEDFVGGTDIETDAQWIARIEANMRYRQGGGNDAQQRAWTRRASNAIEDAFIYPCFLGPNSFAICITKKRGLTQGPLGRVAASPLLLQTTAFMTPPGSPVEPADPFVLVFTTQTHYSDLNMEFDMPAGSIYGWTDAQPWPIWEGTTATPSVASVSTSDALIVCPDEGTLPGLAALATATGDDIPTLMIWSRVESKFYELTGIASIEDEGGGSYRITWSGTRPAYVVAGCYVSPHSVFFADMGRAIVAYFDELGPGELYASTHDFWDRCQRFPEPSYERPARLGGDIAERVRESLGGACATALLTSPVAGDSPPLPTYPSDGPYELVPGHVHVQPLQ